MATPPHGQEPKIDMMQLLKQGIDLKQLMESEQGRPLRQNFDDAYAELLAGFTEKGLTTDVLRSRYDQLQGLLYVLDHMGHTMDVAMMAVMNQRSAKRNVNELLGESGGL